ncbi:MAG: hypothetical protein M1832_006127 [Thelocarpon impressellum]|nr:MAG: hypothetical protein M1832_006127 [Thelocarpon impressellum]
MASAGEATEIFSASLKNPAADFADVSAGEGKKWNELLTTVARWPETHSVHWGLRIEDPTHIHVLIGWDSVEAHLARTQQPDFAAILEGFNSLISLTAPVYHAHLAPVSALPAIYGAPITELAVYYGVPDDFVAKAQDLVKAVQASEGCTGVAHGKVVEKIASTAEGEKSDSHFAVVGWPSVEAHLKASEEGAYLEGRGALAGIVGGGDFFHVKLKEVQ